MKAVVKLKPGYDFMEYMEIEEPIATDDFVKIKLSYSSICGTDLHAFKGEYSGTKPPVVLGHEFSGYVVEIGPEVKHIKIGDRVVSETTVETCGECSACKSGDFNLCSSKIGIGSKFNGGMAEYLISRESSVHPIPDNVTLKEACLTEPLACGVHACMETTNVKKDDVVCVFGVGAIGLLLAQVVKSTGAYVIMAGLATDQENFKIAKSFGVDLCVDQSIENLEDIVNKITDKVGVDKVFECSGSHHALNAAFRIVKKKGEVIQMGVFGSDTIELNVNLLLHKEITHKGSRSSKPSSWKTALKLLEQKSVSPEKIMTKFVDLEHWRDGYEASMAGKSVKSVIVLDDSIE